MNDKIVPMIRQYILKNLETCTNAPDDDIDRLIERRRTLGLAVSRSKKCKPDNSLAFTKGTDIFARLPFDPLSLN
jgi:hypothetical protein